MIERLYIDHFKTFQNFEWKPGSVALLLGRNGTGKTALFDVLHLLRELICEEAWLPSVFPGKTCSRWDLRKEQRFELDVSGPEGISIRVDEQRTGWLRATFASPAGVDFQMSFDELSEGQRVLIVLYVVLYTQMEKGRTIGLDEPDNYVSLDEIQPFLMEALDRAQSGQGPQLFIISHHPEYINQLAPDDGYVMFREQGGPSRVRRFSSSEAIAPSEIVARGGLPREGAT